MKVFCRLVEGKGMPGSELPGVPIPVLLLLLAQPPTKAGSSVSRRYSARRGWMKARAAGVPAQHASHRHVRHVRHDLCKDPGLCHLHAMLHAVCA
jgi:hypothetical protein